MTNRNSNNINIPEAREAMDKFKMEAASEVGVNLKKPAPSAVRWSRTCAPYEPRDSSGRIGRQWGTRSRCGT